LNEIRLIWATLLALDTDRAAAAPDFIPGNIAGFLANDFKPLFWVFLLLFALLVLGCGMKVGTNKPLCSVLFAGGEAKDVFLGTGSGGSGSSSRVSLTGIASASWSCFKVHPAMVLHPTNKNSPTTKNKTV